jgi:hypothetical protein
MLPQLQMGQIAATMQRRRGGREAEGGGLPIHSDPFALIDLHLLALEAPQLHQNTSFAAKCFQVLTKNIG